MEEKSRRIHIAEVKCTNIKILIEIIGNVMYSQIKIIFIKLHKIKITQPGIVHSTGYNIEIL